MTFESVDPTEVPEGAHLIDVREQSEWDAGHAPTAQHLPASSLIERMGELPEEGDLYIVCRGGGRSAQVTQWLNGNGYDAINVRGGMGAWSEAGLPLTADGDAEPYIL
ncbi:rhodanese-like domain-containing protein [Brachybacterium sp. EF45031]|uniref:rhodanese-like domain-containing protein n=1 Tax=Brachybacterium sillae TaxID=2810536 RepID=UPI00217EACC0|nr:rhodanese-like domain-containing protein [Brachybacterium sillae]MCS6712170.1 rhodanese-like domain-containing protein [Brachybacterium sillae]